MLHYLIAQVKVNDDSWIPDHAPYAAARQAGTDSRLIEIDASDAAGTISYLTGGG